uniref:Uncharacterized protein n=1 Tax=Noctiluca scintillans TaxID=2966 RepID=A0A7S1AGF1_NOCSC
MARSRSHSRGDDHEREKSRGDRDAERSRGDRDREGRGAERNRGGDRDRSRGGADRDRSRGADRDRSRGADRDRSRGADRERSRGADRDRDSRRDRDDTKKDDDSFKCSVEGPGATPPSRTTANCYRAVVEMQKPGSTAMVRMTCAWQGDKRSAERDAERLSRAWKRGGFSEVSKVKGELRAARRK